MTLYTFPGGVTVEGRPVPGGVVPVVFVDDPDGERCCHPYPPVPALAVDVWLEQWLGEVALASASERARCS
jgi:hypothetical protein